LRGKPVDRATFVELCDRLSLDPQEIAEPIQELPTNGEESQPPPLPADLISHQDRGGATLSWGEAIDVSAFHGREEELAVLKRWVVDDHCRLITLTGMGGIGKTALSVKLAEDVQAEFEVVIWRSLRNAPPVQDLLTDLLSILSRGRQTEIPATFNHQISQLIEFLRSVRCLLILDNVESILLSEERAGVYRTGYEEYGQLLGYIADTQHQGCLLLTSREKPKGIAAR
jgi:hypothetical protein